MDAALLDTDMLNELLKQKNSQVLQHASAYLGQHGQFAVSSITRYEVVRGLKEKQATRHTARPWTICLTSLTSRAESSASSSVFLPVAPRQVRQQGTPRDQPTENDCRKVTCLVRHTLALRIVFKVPTLSTNRVVLVAGCSSSVSRYWF
jgi:hypothetical protein